jgi:hypothetical protein
MFWPESNVAIHKMDTHSFHLPRYGAAEDKFDFIHAFTA